MARYHFDDLRPAVDGGAASAQFTVPATLPFLRGHFPGLPVVPAMALLEISQAFLDAVSGAPPPSALRARHCKFRRPVGPAESYRLSATREGTAWNVLWHILPETDAGEAATEPVVELTLSWRD